MNLIARLQLDCTPVVFLLNTPLIELGFYLFYRILLCLFQKLDNFSLISTVWLFRYVQEIPVLETEIVRFDFNKTNL